MPGKDSDKIPPEVIDLLKKSSIGYLSVTSSKGEPYSYPVAFYFTGQNVYFFTPISSAKLKFIRSNPRVSLIVDNRLLTKEACGAMIQGFATVFSIGKMFTSLASVVPTTIGISKKYPGMFSFYARGKDLPDDRKLYKYRFVRVKPTKILYWIGYSFGRYVPKVPSRRLGRLFGDLKSDQMKGGSPLEVIDGILESYDENQVMEQPVLRNEPWVQRLDQAVTAGGISEEERKIVRSFTRASSESVAAQATAQESAKLSKGEKAILKKWRDP